MEFVEFARNHTAPGDTLNFLELRDHAAGMLSEIALDMEQPKSEAERERKSKEIPRDDRLAAETAAAKHGFQRADCGFSLQELFAEYRALRGTVVRLWREGHGALDETDEQDLIRFNEALDMTMAESITTYSASIDHDREMFLAMLGHDLRTPLNAIVAGSSFLTTDGGLTGRSLTIAERIYRSGRRMNGLVSDLVDLTHCRLGRGIPVTPVESDLAEIGREAVEEVQTIHSTGELRFEASGNVRGEWDPDRLSQALCNLIANAVQHGGESTPIVVTARGEADEVVVSIHNHGRVIEPEDQERIFDPFERIGSEESEPTPQQSTGLGLYIAQQIALTHGGSIDVRSTEEEGTTFALRLPRRDPDISAIREER